MAPLLSIRFVTVLSVLPLFILCCCTKWLFVSAFEFEVGAINGWIVPPANDSNAYNEWASEKRFQVEDSIIFKYTKDSVMEVNEEDYKNCNSTKPNFFSNNGNTVYPFHRSGFFYFISGAAGHCQKGQKMIVRVMAEDQKDHPDDHGTTSQGFSVAPPAFTFHFLLLLLLLLYFASHFF